MKTQTLMQANLSQSLDLNEAFYSLLDAVQGSDPKSLEIRNLVLKMGTILGVRNHRPPATTPVPQRLSKVDVTRKSTVPPTYEKRRALREAARLSRKDIAQRAGTTVATVKTYEVNRKAITHRDKLVALDTVYEQLQLEVSHV